MKHLFVSVSMSVKQNLFVPVFLHKCLMMLNDVEYTTFKMFVTKVSNYLFVISFQLMFYKTLHYRLARAQSVVFKLGYLKTCTKNHFNCTYSLPKTTDVYTKGMFGRIPYNFYL